MANTPSKQPEPNTQTRLVAGFVQQQVGEVKTMLTALQDRVETVAKAVGGAPDRLADRFLVWKNRKMIRGRWSWFWILVDYGIGAILYAMAYSVIKAWLTGE